MRFGRTEIPNIYFVHAAFFVVIASVGTLMARDVFRGETVPVCSSRMPNGTLFGVESRPGTLLTAEELQSGLAGYDRGVSENLSFVRFSDGPSKSGLRVRMAEVKGTPDIHGRPTIASGVEFVWSPRRMPPKAVNCLSYTVKVPSDFSFGTGGVLPSFVSVDVTNGAPKFQTKMYWRHDGLLTLELKTEASGEKPPVQLELTSSLPLPRGSWARIEQEVILNDIDKDNAEIRVWIDGTIVMWHTHFILRAKPDTHATGVAVTLGYSNGQTPPLDATGTPKVVDLAPFEIRWP